VVQFEFFRLFKSFTERHLEGRERARVLISGRVALRDLLFTLPKRKVPRPYSGAEDGAPSLTGARDDDLFMKIGH
jgi:hypothetical protein